MSEMMEKLGEELFELVERDQGYAYISDGMGSMTRQQFFDMTRRALKHSDIATTKIRSFLRKHGELPKGKRP